MGFWLKKGISFFLMPIPFIFILLGIGGLLWYLRRYKAAKRVGFTALALLFVCSWQPFAYAVSTPLQKQYLQYTPDTPVDYVFVLGHGHSEGGFLPQSAKPSDTALKRLAEGITVYKNNPGAKLIVSGYGGHVNNTPHASVQKQTAIALGVEPKDIITFTKPRDTFQEAQTFGARFEQSTFALVTSAVHMPRAAAIFAKMGLDPVAAPTDYAYGRHINWFDLSGTNIAATEAALHEYLGLVWYKMRGYI